MTRDFIENCVNNYRGENPFILNPFGEMDMMTNAEVVDFICNVLSVTDPTNVTVSII